MKTARQGGRKESGEELMLEGANAVVCEGTQLGR
jgi:hypothetical protein